MWADDEHLDHLIIAAGNPHNAVCFFVSKHNLQYLDTSLRRIPFLPDKSAPRGHDVQSCMERIRMELEQCCLGFHNRKWEAGGIELTQDELTRILVWCYTQRRSLLPTTGDLSFLDGVAVRLHIAHSALANSTSPPPGIQLATLEDCKRLTQALWEAATSKPASTAAVDQMVDDSPAHPMRRDALLKSHEVEWLSVSGRRPTLNQFIAEMEHIRISNGFCADFDNLFLEHKQMPSLLLDSADSNSFGLLLRIPDLSDEYGTSITTITNRVCFMVHRTARLVVTYHACEEDPFDGFQREWEAGRHASTGLERIAETMIRRVLRTYNKGVAALREAVDELESREPGVAARKLDDTARVQRLSLIAKKSAVYKRCADATRETLAELEDVEWMEPFAKTLCDGLATVASMTDELASNALASIDLTIALSEFKSNTNLKNFTYMSILLQPVAIATSWYGMNWANMPELEYENAYYIFAVVTWVVAALIFSYFVLHGRILDAFRPSLHGAEGVQTNDGESLSTANKSDSDLRPWRRFSRLLSLAPVAPRAASVAGNASGEGSSSPLKKDGGSGGSSGSGNVLPDEQPSVPLDDTLGPPVRSGTISNKRVSDDVVLLPVVDLEGDVNPLLPH